MKYFKSRESFIARNRAEAGEFMDLDDLLGAFHDMITVMGEKANKDDIETVLGAFNEEMKRRNPRARGEDNSAARKVIGERLSEFTVDDLILMVHHMFNRWWGTDQQEYLRTSTLFRVSKCSGYVNHAINAMVEQEKKEAARKKSLNLNSDNFEY